MRSPEELTVAFRAAGLKVTPQRQLLFRLLHNNTSHPTADTLHSQASELRPGISLRPVYQTLSDLVDMGEIKSVEVGAGAQRFDPNISGHHHAVCDVCGGVQDVHVATTPELIETHDFTVNDARIVYSGTCSMCAGVAA